MSIDERYFQSDKNYLLKTVQAFAKESLLDIWTGQAFEAYMIMENPMGLEDDFTKSLRANIRKGKSVLDSSYDLLAAIFRYKNGDNQLSFLWDGRTHMEYYDETWRETFKDWVSAVSLKPEVYRSIIKASMATKGINTHFLEVSVRRAILKQYKVKLSRRNVLKVQSA